MHSSYTPYTRIQLCHGYFSDGMLRVFDVYPSQETAADLLRHGLLMKKAADGFTLLYDQQFAGEHRAVNDVLPSGLVLRFLFSCSDPAFWHYTGNLEGYEHGGTVLYFNKSYMSDSGVRLHNSEYVGGDCISRDMSRVFLPGTLRHPVAIVDIERGRIEGGTNIIQFAPRACYWRYILRSQRLLDLEKPIVKDKTQQVAFAEPEWIQLPDQQRALRYVSMSPINILERPNANFQLLEYSDQDESRQKIVIRALPNPDVHRLTIPGDTEGAGASISYSDIII